MAKGGGITGKARGAKTSRQFSTRTMQQFRSAARRISAAAKAMGGALGPTLRMIGEEIMTDVKASRPGQGVPRDEGTLANSGRVEGPFGDDKNPQVSLNFGGAAVKYALVQHENTRFKHKLGEVRYLVRGMERWKPGGKASIAALRANMAAGLRAVRGRK